jgi:large subunit ribosomal protein L18
MPSISSRQIRHRRIRKKVSGTIERPRLSVYFSGQHITAQVINDTSGITLASVHTTEKQFKGNTTIRPNITTAIKVGQLIAARGLSKNIKKVVFDRGGFSYHGKIKALAEAARTAGLEF